MRKRITIAIVGVTALILLMLGIPLAIMARLSIANSEVVELQSIAARTLSEIIVPMDPNQLGAIQKETDAPPPFSVYDSTGLLVYGDGPKEVENVVNRALGGDPSSTISNQIVIATPIADGSSENIIGALRLTESLNGVNRRAQVAWLIMAGSALAALLVAWLIATRLARRLTTEIVELSKSATQLGDGGTPPRIRSTGMKEIDILSASLNDAFTRINSSMIRERQFSSDVSHQLRTPLTAIRLRLESVDISVDSTVIAHALGDVARLESTIDYLLAFARDAVPTSTAIELGSVAKRCKERWSNDVVQKSRTLKFQIPGLVYVVCSDRSIDQILDVLIDNALQHGVGEILISIRKVAGGGVLDVVDAGIANFHGETSVIFDRGHGRINGIGLSLARSLAEAEGGRLVLASETPTTFSLFFLGTTEHDAPAIDKSKKGISV